AQEQIFRNLYKDASASNEELIQLALAVSTACDDRIKIIPGPVKGELRARQKTAWDYGGDFYDLKDVVRMTIIADDANYLSRVRQALVSHCVASNGYGMIKNAETLPEHDPCGYSGINFVAKLPNGRSGEIQANTPNIMYGKMSKEKFVKFLAPQKHTEIEAKYRIECGLGHGLYEIFRSNTQGCGQAAADLSKRYYGFLRSPNPNIAMRDNLQAELTAFKKKFSGVF
ncbi:MAG: hypothetical protein OQJ89_02815, partial [Kangiellaceae bacterium]|nr:hypothetical protein [Kangiellaceae bacterium]